MPKKANPAAVGIFVIGAIVLAVVSLVIFGSGKFFTRTEPFIMYFDDSVNGLDVGAPVKFKGVRIGQVRRIYIRYNQPPESEHIAVMVDIETERLQTTLGVADFDLGDEEHLAEQIDAGLRARLQLTSFVTGLLFIEMDYYPDAGKPDYVQVASNGREALLEIPTMGSDLSEVFKSTAETLSNLSKIDFDTIGQRVESILGNLDRQIVSVDVEGLNRETGRALANLNALLENPQLENVPAKLNQTLDSVDSMIGEGKTLIASVNSKVDPLAGGMNDSLVQLKETLASAQRFVAQAESYVGERSEFRFNLHRMLAEVEKAARSVRLLAELAEQYPNAFITGKPEPQVER